MMLTSERSSVPDFFSPQVTAARRFYLDLAPRSAEPLVVVCGGWEHCAADYEIRRATFPYYSLEFVAGGRGRVTLSGRAASLTAGTLFAYGPGVAQHITTQRSEPLIKYFVDFAGTQAQAILGRQGIELGTCFQIAALSDVLSAFENLVRDGQRSSGCAAELCQKMLEYLLVKIRESRVPGQAGPTLALETYQRCRRHVVEHCDRLMSLDEVARECHVDRSYLCRLFRRYDHQTPHQFLMRQKMNLAAERLQEPESLVKQVARSVGFQDPFHFSRVFKRVFGVSPANFRQLR